MMGTTIATCTGLRARIGRRLQLISINWTLHWAENDHAHLAHQAQELPKRLRQLDHDLQALRVLQATLRSGR